jgi:transcriptional regulator with XRE-family HTH domain
VYVNVFIEGEYIMDINNIGKRILRIRQETGFSQAKFARFADVGYGYLGTIELGKKKPSFNFIVSVLDATKVSADWLLTGEGAMYLPTKKEKEEIKEINEDSAAYGVSKSYELDEVLDTIKRHWDTLSDGQKKILVEMVKEMVKNNEILLEENRMLRDFLIKMATKPHGEMPSNIVQGLAD